MRLRLFCLEWFGDFAVICVVWLDVVLGIFCGWCCYLRCFWFLTCDMALDFGYVLGGCLQFTELAWWQRPGVVEFVGRMVLVVALCLGCFG